MTSTSKLSAILRHLGLWLGLVFLSTGLLVLLIFYPYKINTEIVSLKVPSTIPISNNIQPFKLQQLVGKLYLPHNTAAPYPTIILWHGVSSSKEMTEPLALELARHGIAALTFDSGGFGESYRRNFSAEANLEDARIAFQYVKQHPELFDQTRLGIGGHSMGAATAMTFAAYTIDSAQIRVTIDLGMSAEVTTDRPANLLMGIGLYEEFHTPSAMAEMLQEATKAPPVAGQMYGNFANGTARKLVIAPTSDHLMEPFDSNLIAEAVQWSRQSFDLPPIPINLTVPWLMKGWFMALLGAILTAGYGMKYLRYLGLDFLERELQANPQSRIVSFGISGITGIILLLGMAHILAPRIATNLILTQAMILPISNYGLQQAQRLSRTLRLCGLYVLVIIAAYTTMAVLIAFPEILKQPIYLLHLPQFFLEIPIALVYSRVQEFSAAMFTAYTSDLVPHWQLLLLFLPELIYPGVTFGWGTKMCRWLIQWVRQPLQLNLAPNSKCNSNHKSLYLLGGLSLMLGIILNQQLQLGLGSMEHITTALRILWQMLIAPLLLIILTIRTKYFQRIEAKL